MGDTHYFNLPPWQGLLKGQTRFRVPQFVIKSRRDDRRVRCVANQQLQRIVYRAFGTISARQTLLIQGSQNELDYAGRHFEPSNIMTESYPTVAQQIGRASCRE